MSRIDDLIAKHCPNGVGFKNIGDVIIALRTGLNPRSNFKLNTANAVGYYVTVRELDGWKVNFLDKTDRIDDAALKIINNRSRLKVGDILFSGTGTIGRTALIESMPENWNIKEGIYAITPNQSIITSKYLLYNLVSEQVAQQLQLKSAGSTVVSIPMASLRTIKIPVPPLEIQQEIVDILDAFTKLEAELEAELEARQLQYAHYRDELLNFAGKDVPLLELDSVCARTSNIKWKEHTGEEYEYIDLSSVDRENNQITETQKISDSSAPSRAQQIVLKDDIIFGTTRPTLKRFCFIPEKYDGQICSTGFCVLRADKKKILPKFLFFSITTSAFNDYVERNQEGVGYPSISNSKVKGFQISVPPLKEQERIVAILDKFYALVNDISIGLPAEITARRQQYEHYRNKLLTFKEAA